MKVNIVVRTKGMFCTMGALLLSGCCSKRYYANDPVVFANVKKRADFPAGAGSNLGEYTSGLYLHGPTAILDQYLITGSFTNCSGRCEDHASNNGASTITTVYFKGNSFLGAFGYYKFLGSQWYFEGSAGAKYGTNVTIRRPHRQKWPSRPGEA